MSDEIRKFGLIIYYIKDMEGQEYVKAFLQTIQRDS